MELYSSAFGNHPTPPKVSGLGVMVATQQEVKNLACRKSSGGIQAPGACGPGLQGAWGPGLQGLGPGPPGVWASQITIFSQTSWWEPGEGVGVGSNGCFGGGDLEGNEAGIPALPPPPPPPPPPRSATIQHAPQGRRTFHAYSAKP